MSAPEPRHAATPAERLAQLADEQAALRRVATLVARGAPSADVFKAVVEELGRLLGVGSAGLVRFESADTGTVVAGSGRLGEIIPVGTRLPLGGTNTVSQIARTGRPARVDDFGRATGEIAHRARRLDTRASAGVPVVVAGRVWGAMIVAALAGETLPPDVEPRLEQFTELIATAIANAEARVELERLAEQQAALRRVATLVAETATPAEVFDAVIVEVAQLLGAAQVGLMRAESPGEVTIVAHRGQVTGASAGLRLPLTGDSATARVVRTRRSARVNHYDQESGPIARVVLSNKVAVTVGAPVTVEGRLWGVITASWLDEDAPPLDAEERLVEFAGLLETAIANADSRDQLMASRARLLTEGDEARRRVVRDIHDGAQQRLVHTIVTLKLAQRALDSDPERTRSLLGEALEQAEQGNAELRELAHGILPSVLARGLRAAVESIVSRVAIAVRTEITDARLPRHIEASAYFILAGALTNVVKHAHARNAEITAVVDDGTLHLTVRDDGVGGADATGSGLLGLADRAAALGGRLRIDSPPGGGTAVIAELPLPPHGD